MINKTGRVLAVALIVVVLISSAAFAGGRDRAGTSSGVQLLIPVGARYLALGGAASAVCTGVEAIYWNPAGLAAMGSNSQAMFSYMPYIADIGVTYGAVGVKAGQLGTFGVSMKVLNIGAIDVTTADMPDGTGETYTPTFFTITASFARQLTDRVFVGVNANFINERFSRVNASGVGVDIGIQYKNLGGIEGLSTGIVIKNLGAQLKYDGSGLYRKAEDFNADKTISYLKIDAASFDLPSIFEIGLSYSRNIGENASVTGSYLFQNNNYSDDESKLGAEAAFKDMAFLRVGYTMAPDKPEDFEYLYGLTFGGGVHLKTGGMDLYLDYAWRQIEMFSSSNVFSLKLGF
ncbi:PorV/PorQ family protein [bacterium]|nr:PorV/PorQ family protein [bacterium]